MHRPIADGVIAALSEIFLNQKSASKVVALAIHRNRKWGSRDRRQFAEAVYELVRWWRRDLWLCGIDWPPSDVPPPMPTSEFAQVLACYTGDASPRMGLEDQSEAVRLSIPDWLDQWGLDQIEDWRVLAPHLNEPAPVFLRANSLKCGPAEVRKRLKYLGIGATVLSGDALVLEERTNVSAIAPYQQGMFELQDLHSQAIAPMVQVESGHSVLDGCAGAGGKTLHLAALLKNRGEILARDISQPKLAELEIRSKRAGVRIVKTQLISEGGGPKLESNKFDRILLDVPCSGIGVLRRNPDFKWKLSVEKIERLKKRQAEILDAHVDAIKIDGRMVYSTCSLAKGENQAQVKAFMERHPGRFDLEDEKVLTPGPNKGDGFYAARLRRLS